jgi:hypothetical protein
MTLQKFTYNILPVSQTHRFLPEFYLKWPKCYSQASENSCERIGLMSVMHKSRKQKCRSGPWARIPKHGIY